MKATVEKKAARAVDSLEDEGRVPGALRTARALVA